MANLETRYNVSYVHPQIKCIHMTILKRELVKYKVKKGYTWYVMFDK